jgi:hypothetical protein
MSCILRYSEIDLTLPLAVVAHDAGAANLIAGWLRDMSAGDVLSAGDVRLSVEGAALTIFSRELPQLKNMALTVALNGANTLLSGTSSRASNIEHEARAVAHKCGIYSIGVIDHWVNYAERFFREERQILPDEIWVSDEIALSIAQDCFPNHSVRLLPNRYLEQLVELINSNHNHVTDGKVRVLYVLEPIHERWGSIDTPGEFQALDFFVSKLELLGFTRDTEILLRAHPSEPLGKYEAWCAAHAHLGFTVDTTRTLPDMIAWADWVVGCETFAMIIALHANKRVLSSLPPQAAYFRLPHREIRLLRDL